jgi:hypothetical protein
MYYRGVPFEPDIKKLRETYPEARLRQGQIIPYHEVERLLHERKDSNRWKGVTNQWRKVVEDETGVILGVERGEGFKVLEEGEKLDLCCSKLRSAAKFARRSYEVASRVATNQLSEEDKLRLDFFVTKSSKIIAASQMRSKKSLKGGTQQAFLGVM